MLSKYQLQSANIAKVGSYWTSMPIQSPTVPFQIKLKAIKYIIYYVHFKPPVVAGAVLTTVLWIINSISQIELWSYALIEFFRKDIKDNIDTEVTEMKIGKQKFESLIIYIVYHLEWFTIFQTNKNVEAQPRPFYSSEK